MEETKFVTKM